MKNLITTILALFAIIKTCIAQDSIRMSANLVPNPSFEDTRACPKESDYIGGVVHWNLFPNFSADYFHRCANYFHTEEYQSRFPFEQVPMFAVPTNMFGFQDARTGDAYAGLSFCNEALCVKLEQPLFKDSLYSVEFFVSLADSSNVAAKHFGMYLSQFPVRAIADSWMNINGFILEHQPQIQNNPEQCLSDTAQWIKIHGQFQAKGGEQFVTIGGFLNYHDSIVCKLYEHRALKSTYRSNEKYLGYYFVDDVSVKQIEHGYFIELNKYYILKKIYFEFDKSELIATSFKELDRLVKYLQEHENHYIYIVGHTDALGTDEHNKELSTNRAREVAKYLEQHQIAPVRIKSCGRGALQSIGDNQTEAGRALNRRVEFVITENHH